jgi:hypothetical protein
MHNVRMLEITRIIALLSIVMLFAGCGSGGGTSSIAPTAIIQANAQVIGESSTPTIQAALGSTINLDGSSSTSPGSTISSYAWTLTSKPDTSNVSLSADSSARITFVPDVTGTYVITLQVTDAKGMSSKESITLVASQDIPVTNITETVTFSGSGPLLTKPVQNVVVGATVMFDGSASTDPNGGVVTISWQMLQKPADSKATLIITGNTAYFSADAIGQYQVRARGTSTSGAYSDVIYTFNATDNQLSIVIAANVISFGDSGTMTAAIGNLIFLDSSYSTAPAGDTVTKSWRMLAKPSASINTQLSAASGDFTGFVPDTAGDYIIQMSMVDTTTGLASLFTITVQVKQGPTAVISGNATPVALTSAPSVVAAAGTPVTLRGSGSYDPEGSPLAFSWTILTRPATSNATIATPTAQNITFTPDVNGSYIVQLAVSNQSGDVSIRPVTIYVGSYPPVALVDHSQLVTLLGGTITSSAALSYDQDGNTLTFSWSIDSRPAGSNAAIVSSASPILMFTPDVAGTYYATVTVSNGTVSSVASVTITALTASPGTVPLSYLPLQVKFSKGLGKAVIISTNPNALHIVDAEEATDISVALPTAVKSMSLSPDGTLAAVLHEGVVSLVDLNSRTLLHSSATYGSQTDVFINNSGLVFLTGQTGGQWVTPGFTVLDGRTGTIVQTVDASAQIYGTTRGIYSDINNKIFTLSEGLSPAQIYAHSVDPNTGNIGSETGSPYWGDYPMSNPFWLSGDQSLLFTSSGNYFRTSDLAYFGTFNLGDAGSYNHSVLSMSHSSTAQEAVVLAYVRTDWWDQDYTYPSVYKRYTGSLLFPANDVPLPTVGGQQTYGLYIFHAADDTHVFVVQTGSAHPNASGAQYYLISR